jgi:hypothetical protein
VIATMTPPLAIHEYQQGGTEAALEFLKRTRAELRMLRMVRLGRDFFRVYDVNGDSFEVRGLGYLDPAVIPLLEDVNAAYDPATIHRPVDAEYKELKTGRRRPWAEDRVM